MISRQPRLPLYQKSDSPHPEPNVLTSPAIKVSIS